LVNQTIVQFTITLIMAKKKQTQQVNTSYVGNIYLSNYGETLEIKTQAAGKLTYSKTIDNVTVEGGAFEVAQLEQLISFNRLKKI